MAGEEKVQYELTSTKAFCGRLYEIVMAEGKEDKQVFKQFIENFKNSYAFNSCGRYIYSSLKDYISERVEDIHSIDIAEVMELVDGIIKSDLNDAEGPYFECGFKLTKAEPSEIVEDICERIKDYLDQLAGVNFEELDKFTKNIIEKSQIPEKFKGVMIPREKAENLYAWCELFYKDIIIPDDKSAS